MTCIALSAPVLATLTTDGRRGRVGLWLRFAALRELRERHLSARRAQLDADELAAEWAEGRAMTSEQAVAYALEDDEASLA